MKNDQNLHLFNSFKSRIVTEVFEFNEKIGEGTFGIVSRAHLRSNPNEIYALKKIMIENENKIGFPLTAIREIMILNKYKHENLSNLIEVLTSRPAISNNYRGSVYLSFKYMEYDLFGLIHSGKVNMNLPQIKNIMFQILSGVQYLHKNSVIHRDLKTSNILINNKGEVKITDFGLAKKWSTKINKPFTNNVVTLWYRAPEILLGSTNYNCSVDLWSIGCIFCEILLNTPPFHALLEKELFKQINNQIGIIRENNFPGVCSLPFYEEFQLSSTVSSEGKLRKKLETKFDFETVDLAMKLLEIDPKKRITADNALKHNFFKSDPQKCSNNKMPKLDRDFHELNIRNGDYKNPESNNTEKMGLLIPVEEMKVGKQYNQSKIKENEESFLRNKRKNI